jgi:hypothetical protein
MGRVVIVAMRPKPGCAVQLKKLVTEHVGVLRREGLVTDRNPIITESADGTVIEVFEWKSKDAIDAAHENPVVIDLWGRFAEVCDFMPLGEVAEAADLFSEFDALN